VTPALRTVSSMYADPNQPAKLTRPVTDEDRQSFLNSLQQANRHCATKWMLGPEPAVQQQSPANVTELVLCHKVSLTCREQKPDTFITSLSLSDQQIHAVEENTRNQQQNPR